MAILRSFICENSRNCGAWFDAWEPNPKCPECGCVRVSWRPAGGHIGNGAKAGDAELRILADVFKMNDMNSAERGRGAKKVNLPPETPAGSGIKTFAGGFSAAIDPSRGAQCVPTANKVTYKVTTNGNSLAANATYPGIRTNTVVEATHRR
jgi:hypothetical protein